MQPTLHILCGKIASGKSTLAKQLSTSENAILISEDVWLGELFGDQMTTIADYLRCAEKLRVLMSPHVIDLLNAGNNVVLDFPANTFASRAWMREILDQTNARNQLHFLDVPDTTCLHRLELRNRQGDHPFQVTPEQFLQITKHFAPPTFAEGFDIRTHPITV